MLYKSQTFGHVLVDPHGMPRYWPAVWQLFFRGALAESTLRRQLRHLDALYRSFDEGAGFGSSDDAISRCDLDGIVEGLDRFFVTDQGQFEGMYANLYSTQDSLGVLSYHELARRAGVADLRAFDACMAHTSAVPRIERDRQAAIDSKIPGTPGVVIGGILRLESSLSVAEIEEFLKNAQRGRS